jgi:alkylation response protein AidB-like acyl-CoA dehydrogenase
MTATLLNSTRPTSILTTTMLETFAARAPEYDRENRFFAEDFSDLKAAGYLKIAVPTELGGAGLSLAEVCALQRRLAYHAPATAIATNMHLYWTGIAADLYRAGDHSLHWLLEEAAKGEVFAAGHGEAGNDMPILWSSAKAERVENGYRFYGHKVFGSLSPVWTRLGIHAVDYSDPKNPLVVHAFMPRYVPGYRIEETWDTLGMRATKSDDTILEGAFVPDHYIGRVVPAGLAGADAFVLGIFAWAEPTFASIYTGIAERARDLALKNIARKTSIAMSGRSLVNHPEVQHAVAEITLELESMIPQVERIAQEWSDGVDHGGAWVSKLIAAKYRCVEGAKKVVDIAMDLSGGTGMFKGSELERLYRDVRCGGFHPANRALVHEFVGKTALGVLGAAGPRWG